MFKMNALHILIGALLMFFTGYIVFMIFDTTPPYEYDVTQSKIVPHIVEGGVLVEVDWKISKFNRTCPGINIRVLFDPKSGARITVYDPVPTASRSDIKENDSHLIRTFLVPMRISKGLVGYRAHQSYQCNWLQKFFPLEITTPDLFFEMIDHVDKP